MIEITTNDENLDFSKLASLVAKGETVLINYDGFPQLKLSAAKRICHQLTKEQAAKRLGGLSSEFQMPTDEEWNAMDKEIEDMFEESINKPFPQA